MQNFLGELRVKATHENLRTISFFVQGIGARLNLEDGVQFEIEVSIEEACTNIITHAYDDDNRGDIHISAELIANTLKLTLLDWGHPFDPTSVKPFDITAPVEARIQGGMGLHFIRNFMDGMERTIPRHDGEPNVLILAKKVVRSKGITISRQVRESQELQALQAITTGMTAGIKLDDLLMLIVNKLVETIGADRGTLYLIDEEAGELWSKVLLEDDDVLPEVRVKIGEGIAGFVAETGEIINLLNAHDSPRFNPAFDVATGYTTETLLTVPMRNPQQKTIGVVQLLNKIGGPFTKRDERLLTAMASQASISIENARLYAQELQQQLIKRELETAHAIQQSFLPEGVPHLKGWDVAAFWQPVLSVAGDFYDFMTLDDGRQAVVIADVSGKGIPAALFMALSVTVLRFGISLNLPPDEVINRANRLILMNQRSRMFATIFIAYLDPVSGDLAYATAGHNPPIVYRRREHRCEMLDAAGVAVGVFKQASYDEETLNLENGDILVLYTDGITEIIDAEEEEFGEERLQTLILENAHHSADAITSLILTTISDFAGNEGAADDETLVIIKRNA